ncbi:hypothetical protein [Streptomyces sp. GSL17-111]|uniref:hypothetical protein n=1 Tax=Streptomyces sp. GSL17-111 TaxID=3121596 RepID=UPI0030F46C4A
MYQDFLAHEARIAGLRAEAEHERLVAAVKRHRSTTRRGPATRRISRWVKAA